MLELRARIHVEFTFHSASGFWQEVCLTQCPGRVTDQCGVFCWNKEISLFGALR